MRKIFAAGLAGVVFLLGFGVPAAQADEEPGDTPPAETTLKVSRANYSPNYKAATSANVRVTTNAASWAATDDADWVTLSATSGASGGVFKISVTQNTGDERIATVTVTAGTKSAVINVTQGAVPPTVSLNPAEAWTPTWQASSTEITVTSNMGEGWTATSSKAWLTVTASGASGGKATLKVAENTGAARLATVTFKSGTAKATLRVKQSTGPMLVLGRALVYLSNEGQSDSVTIYSPGANWAATVTSGSEWLHISPATGADKEKITLTADPNPNDTQRQAVVHVTNGYNAKDLKVTQRKPFDFASAFKSLLCTILGALPAFQSYCAA